MYRLKAGLLVGLLMVLLLPVTAVGAVDNNESEVRESILLSPVSKRYQLKAGDTRRDELTVINDGQQTFNFTAYSRPYSVTDEEYTANFTLQAQNADAYKWIQFDKSSYKLKPGATVKVGYIIRIPKDATPGGHYGVLFTETQPSDEINGNAVKRKKRVGSILYVTVDGNIKRSGALKSSSVSFFQLKPPLTTATRVENTGNTDFVVKSQIKVFDAFGGKKFQDDKEHTILPKTTRKLPLEWTNASWLGFYKVELTTSFLDTNKTSTHYVLLVPLWVYLTLVLLILGRVLYAVANRRKR